MTSMLEGKKLYGLLALMCVVFLAMFFLTDAGAKYTSANNTSQNARTAEFIFDINQKVASKEYTLKLNPTTEHSPEKIEIVGESEEAFELKITMKLMGNLPLKVEYGIAETVNGEQGQSKPIVSSDPIVTNTISDKYNHLRDKEGVMTIELERIPYKPATDLELLLDYDISWTDEEGYDSAIYENGVELVEVIIEATQTK